MPLVRGHFGLTSPYWVATGGLANLTQGNEPARSNIEYLGYNPSDNAIATTGVSISVPVPVDVGQVIKQVGFLVGNTAEATGTHSFVAIYSGIATPALLAQSTDNTGAAALAANALYTQTLTSSILITPTNAPNGFIYATLCVTAGTIPTIYGGPTIATTGNYQLQTGAPLFLSGTHGSAQGATAAGTIATPTAAAHAPYAFLQ